MNTLSVAFLLIFISLIAALLEFEPKPDWNMETEELLIWYNCNGLRKYFVLWRK